MIVWQYRCYTNDIQPVSIIFYMNRVCVSIWIWAPRDPYLYLYLLSHSPFSRLYIVNYHHYYYLAIQPCRITQVIEPLLSSSRRCLLLLIRWVIVPTLKRYRSFFAHLGHTKLWDPLWYLPMHLASA